MITKINRCRGCRSSHLESRFNLGVQALTGRFPKPGERVPAGPLHVVRCTACGLLQLEHDYALPELFGEGYGYRSGLNEAMIKHLHQVYDAVHSQEPEVVLDIGSNDGTLLNHARSRNFVNRCIGIDPLAKKFEQHYSPKVDWVNGFFSSRAFFEASKGKRADLVFSMAMMYDLTDPVDFMGEVADVLTDDGIWVIEVAYLPTLARLGGFDFVNHEHLEYYTLESLQRLLAGAGLYVQRARLTSTNGGSLLVHVGKQYRSPLPEPVPFDVDRDLQDLWQTTWRVTSWTRDTLRRYKAEGKLVCGYGASTKGNVLLQAAGIDTTLLPVIGEVNIEKYGRVTPGTQIPIMSMEDVRACEPAAYLVLPWHFRDGIIEQEQEFLDRGGELIFPLPKQEIFSKVRA